MNGISIDVESWTTKSLSEPVECTIFSSFSSLVQHSEFNHQQPCNLTHKSKANQPVHSESNKIELNELT